MLKPRRIDIDKDRGILLDFHSRTNYEVDSPWARALPFEEYRELWLGTKQPEVFLSDLRQSMNDGRTIAAIWEDNGSIVAYVWAVFTDLGDYSITIGEVSDIFVEPDYRRRGIALMILSRVEQLARQRGAHLLRSGTGIEDIASQMLHVKAGFQIRRFEYEKVLKNPGTKPRR